jgi:hypothetical protein
MKAQSSVWKPTTAEKAKKLQGAVEISSLCLKSGGSSFVSIYDATTENECNENSLRWVLDAAAATPDNNFFTEPIVFAKGVFAICDQGWDANPHVCVAASKYVN